MYCINETPSSFACQQCQTQWIWRGGRQMENRHWLGQVAPLLPLTKTRSQNWVWPWCGPSRRQWSARPCRLVCRHVVPQLWWMSFRHWALPWQLSRWMAMSGRACGGTNPHSQTTCTHGVKQAGWAYVCPHTQTGTCICCKWVGPDTFLLLPTVCCVGNCDLPSLPNLVLPFSKPAMRYHYLKYHVWKAARLLFWTVLGSCRVLYLPLQLLDATTMQKKQTNKKTSCWAFL